MTTYMQLLNVREILSELAGTRLPPRLALRVARSGRIMFKALERLEKIRVGHVGAYAKHDRHGDVVRKDNKIVWQDEETFKIEWQDALDSDAEIEINPIQLKHFPRSVEFTPPQCLALLEAGFIKEN